MSSTSENHDTQKTHRHLILGVDPGQGGALAYYDPYIETINHLYDMPVAKNIKGGTEKISIDTDHLAVIIKSHADQTIFAIVEENSSRPEQGVASTFKFGLNSGLIIGMIVANFIPLHLTRPQVWKTLMNLSKDKDLSRRKAIQFFPDQAGLFERKKDDGRAEAALLAKFGERVLRP